MPSVVTGLGALCAAPLAVLVAVLVARAVWWAARWVRQVRRMARVAASIPGPPTLPLIGNFLDISRDARRLLGSVKGLLNEYGFLLRLWLGPFLVVFILDGRDAEVVATECPDKPWLVYRLVAPVLGRGMVLLNGRDHRRHRKLITPSLHRGVLEHFAPLMRLAGEELLDSMRAMAVTGEVFDATPLCGDASLDSTYRTILNADDELFMGSRPLRRQVVRHVDRLSQLLMHRAVHPWLHSDWLYWLHGNYQEFNSLTSLYDRLIMDVLEHKLARIKEQYLGPTEEEPAFPRKRQAFLDYVLASEGGRALTKEELFNELKTMVAGGFATSQDSMSMMFLVLAILPDIQAKIQQELDDIFAGDPDRPIELSDLDHMEYMERFIKESLRMYPPFAVLPRSCTKDVKLPSGHTLPAGCHVVMSPLATHWNPEHYPEPSRFDPDRFLPEESRARNPCAFLAFSAGPRNCIGGRYAIMFLKTCIASVLRHLNVLPDPDGPQQLKDIKMVLGVTFFPERGARVRVQPRQKPR